MSNKNKGKKSIFRMIADIISWTIFALLMLLAAFLIYYVIATNIYARKGERFRPIVSLYTIISGSMLPTIKVYDVVVNLKIDDPVKLKEGDVITFISQSKINYGETITHRINKITYNNGTYYFTTKGDNNLVPDETPVEFNNIIGKVVLKIPQLGQAQFFLLKQGSKLFLVLIPSFGILIYDLLKMLNLFDTKKKVDKSLETKDNKLSKEEEEKLKEEIKNRLSNKSLINEDIIDKENEDKHLEEEKEIKTEESKETDKIDEKEETKLLETADSSPNKEEENKLLETAASSPNKEDENKLEFLDSETKNESIKPELIKEEKDKQEVKTKPKNKNNNSKNKQNNNRAKSNYNGNNKSNNNRNNKTKKNNTQKKKNSQNKDKNKELDIDVDKVLKKIKEKNY